MNLPSLARGIRPRGYFGVLIQVRGLSNTDTNNIGKNVTQMGKRELTFDGANFLTWPKHRLLRNWMVYKTCEWPFLVENSMTLMNMFKRLPGFPSIMKASYYGQFVGGNSDTEIQRKVDELTSFGIEPMLCVPVESELSPTQRKERDAWQEENTDSIVNLIDKTVLFVGKDEGKLPVFHVKLTGLIDEPVLLKLSELIGIDVTKSTTLEQYVDGLASLMTENNAKPEIMLKNLTPKEFSHITDVAKRLARVGQHLVNNDVEMAVDAEYINMNPAITWMSLAMAKAFNTSSKSYIWNTYQCYLKNTPNVINYELDFHKRNNIAFGAKIVRGAYIDSESKRAKEGGYENPVHDSIEETHACYNQIMTMLIDKAEKTEEVPRFLIASHNEESIKLAYSKIQEALERKPDIKERILFGQLYGMCDHISAILADAGLHVYKSMPIGTINDVMPYLARRAVENQSVLKGSHREKDLIWKALKGKIG